MTGTSNDGAKRGRVRRRLLAVAASAALALCLAEASLRFLLFSDTGLARRLGSGLRDPERFADRSDPASWKLRFRFESSDADRPHSSYDARLGWRHPLVDPATRQHVDLAILAGRRPVLMYGDSFVHCVGAERDCWQGLVDRSPLGAELVVLNHGMGGYGLDQIVLSYQDSIDGYAALDPIVVVGVMVDDDLDRCALDFRNRPKPRLRVGAGGELVLPDEPVERDGRAYIEARGIGIESYLFELVNQSTALVPAVLGGRRGRASRRYEEVRDLTRALLEELARDVRARGLDCLVWVLHGRACMGPRAGEDWREPFLLAELSRLGLAHLLSRDALLADRAATGRGEADYYLVDGHLTPLGNELVARPLLAELERLQGRVGATAGGAPASAVGPEAARLDFAGAIVESLTASATAEPPQFFNGPLPRFDTEGSQRRLVLRAGAEGPVEITYRLLRPARRLTAGLRRVRAASERETAGVIRFTVRVDGEEALHIDLAPDAASVPLDVSLEGAQRFTLSAAPAGVGAPPGACYLVGPAVHL